MRSGTKSILLGTLIFLAAFAGLRYFLPFLFPFLMGLGLALAAEPGVRFLCSRLRLPRGLSAGIGVTAAFALVFALILGLAALLVRELGRLSGILPELEQAALSGIGLLEQWLLALSDRFPRSIRALLRQSVTELFSGGTALLTGGAQYLLGLAGAVLTHLPDRAFSLFTGVVSGYLFSARLPGLRRRLREKLSGKRLQALLSLLGRLRRTAGRWLLAQLKLSGITLLILLAGMILLKIPYAPVWALCTALLDALPVFGTGTVLLPWSLICLLRQDSPRALGFLGIYLVVTLTRSSLEPRLLGRQLGLDPLITLAALYTGYRLWGFGGMILSPLLAVTAFQLISEPGNPR